MEGFPSGQREQTVNLSSMTSVVRIHHLPPKQKDIPKGMSFFCFGGRWLWIRKVALRNVPVARFNWRGLPVGRQPLKYLMVVPAAKRIHHRTGRQACSSATMGGNNQSRQARAQSEGKNRLCSIAKSTCTGVCNDILPFATLSRRGAQCAPGQRKIIRFAGEHSDTLRAACGGCSLDVHCGGCVRPYGSAGVDEFTSGVPRSYLRAPSLAALPQFTVAHPTG